MIATVNQDVSNTNVAVKTDQPKSQDPYHQATGHIVNITVHNDGLDDDPWADIGYNKRREQ